MKREALNFYRVLITGAILFILPFNLTGQDRGVAEPVLDTLDYTLDDNLGLFESEEILDIKLRFDITRFIKMDTESDYIDGILTIYSSEGDSITKKVLLKPRGNSRIGICTLPPIRINFRTDEEDGKEVVKNMKLVSYCNPAGQFQTYILREYLAYKLYNLITDYSFRVRLLRIVYEDIGSRGINQTRYGFIIEPVDMFEKRHNLKEVQDIVVRSEFLSPRQYDRFALFEYMIGNDDWYLPSLHNLKLFVSPDNRGINAIPVPYDFDYSGLVNANYAVPNPLYNLESITYRVYMGDCRDEDEYRVVMDEFLVKKEEMLSLIGSLEPLHERERRVSLRYIESFFGEYRRDNLILNIKRTCKATEK